jgi:hypothetical protein
MVEEGELEKLASARRAAKLCLPHLVPRAILLY